MESNNSTLFQQIRDVFFNDAYKTIDEKEVYALVTNVRRSLSIETTENPPYKEAIDSGFVPLIISALKKDKCITDLLKLELVWILTNISSSKDAKCLLDEDILTIASDFVQTESNDMLEQIVLLIGNIAGDNIKARDSVLKRGFVSKFLEIYNHASSTISVKAHIIWAFANMLHGDPFPKFDDVRIFLPCISETLKSNDLEILENSLWVFFYFSKYDHDEVFECLFRTINLSRLVYLTNVDAFPFKIINIALKVLRNLTSGSDDMCQKILDQDCLMMMRKLIYHQQISIRIGAWFVLSNISACSSKQIDQVLKSGILEDAVYIINEFKDDYRVLKEVLWTISNATREMSSRSLLNFAGEDYIRGVANFLTPDRNDVKMYSFALETIHICLESAKNAKLEHIPQKLTSKFQQNERNIYVQIIEKLGVRDTIQDFLQYGPEDLCGKALFILSQYFKVSRDVKMGDESFADAIDTDAEMVKSFADAEMVENDQLYSYDNESNDIMPSDNFSF